MSAAASGAESSGVGVFCSWAGATSGSPQIAVCNLQLAAVACAQIGYRGAQKLRADVWRDGVGRRFVQGIVVCWVCLAA